MTPRALLAGVSLLAALAIGTPGCGTRGAERAARAEPAAGSSSRAATDSADRRVRDGRFLEALPWLEQVERLTPRTTADFEGAFATALRNAAFQVRELDGRTAPATRSSIERVALVRESLRRVELGVRKADGAALVSRLVVVRAAQLRHWGFAREAYEEFWRAHEAHALALDAQAEAAALERQLRDPAVVLAPGELSRPAEPGQW